MDIFRWYASNKIFQFMNDPLISFIITWMKIDVFAIRLQFRFECHWEPFNFLLLRVVFQPLAQTYNMCYGFVHFKWKTEMLNIKGNEKVCYPLKHLTCEELTLISTLINSYMNIIMHDNFSSQYAKVRSASCMWYIVTMMLHVYIQVAKWNKKWQLFYYCMYHNNDNTLQFHLNTFRTMPYNPRLPITVALSFIYFWTTHTCIHRVTHGLLTCYFKLKCTHSNRKIKYTA